MLGAGSPVEAVFVGPTTLTTTAYTLTMHSLYFEASAKVVGVTFARPPMPNERRCAMPCLLCDLKM